LPNNDLAFAGQLSPLQAERTASSPDAERLETTLARVRHIVGRENVGSPYLLNTHRPDRFVLHPFRPHTAPDGLRFSAKWTEESVYDNPLRDHFLGLCSTMAPWSDGDSPHK